jgi:hypothetical protein
MDASVLSRWESFYVIVGSSAGALTGLQFVVMALISDIQRLTQSDTIAAFATPNIVHFCVVLLLSAILSAPWERVASVDWVLVILGVCGVVYAAIITRRTFRQNQYKPVLEDWVWHVILPTIAYGMLLISSLILTRSEDTALFVLAAVSLLLLFVGIHNAWDTVTFLVTEQAGKRRDEDIKQ